MKMPYKDYFPEIKKEAELYEPLVNLFKVIYQTDNVEITDKKREEKHGCDIILDINNLIKIGFQVKKTEFTKITLDKEFKNNVRNAAAFKFGVGSVKKMSQFIWITTKNTTYTISDSEVQDIIKDLGFSKEVEIWDGKLLYETFLNKYPEAFTNIKIDALTLSAEDQSKNGNHIFASHFLFRVFTLYLIQSNTARTQEVIEKAILEFEKQKNYSIYFYRTLKRFYETWRQVVAMNGFDDLIKRYKSENKFSKQYEKISDEYEKIWMECIFLMQLVNDDKVKKHIEKKSSQTYLCGYNFLCDTQFIYAQLQILYHEYSNSPAGLSSLQICRTLLRFGFPPVGNIGKRILSLKTELESEHHCSIDSECSLCSATALSILILANCNDDKSDIKAIKSWLKKLKDSRYSHLRKNTYSTDANNAEHALHYAAQVLNAFIDCEDIKTSKLILDCFFKNDSVGKDGFYIEWMMHRNISNTETCAYIFSTFLRYLLSTKNNYPLNAKQQSLMKSAIANLVTVLHNETTPQSKPWRLYSTRENIQSLCLGLLVGEKASTIELLNELMQNIHYRAIRIKRESQKKVLLDSNVERTTRLIEGWVSYWETITYLVNDAPDKDANGNKLKRTVTELKKEGYLPNYQY